MAGGDSTLPFISSCLVMIRASPFVLSGRSPQALTLDLFEGRGFSAETSPSAFDALNVTVPGAPACWCDTVQLFGSQKVYLFVFSATLWELKVSLENIKLRNSLYYLPFLYKMKLNTYSSRYISHIIICFNILIMFRFFL